MLRALYVYSERSHRFDKDERSCISRSLSWNFAYGWYRVAQICESRTTPFRNNLNDFTRSFLAGMVFHQLYLLFRFACYFPCLLWLKVLSRRKEIQSQLAHIVQRKLIFSFFCCHRLYQYFGIWLLDGMNHDDPMASSLTTECSSITRMLDVIGLVHRRKLTSKSTTCKYLLLNSISISILIDYILVLVLIDTCVDQWLLDFTPTTGATLYRWRQTIYPHTG